MIFAPNASLLQVLRQNTLWIVENTAAAGDHTQIVEVIGFHPLLRSQGT